jgi:hypothetical protein
LIKNKAMKIKFALLATSGVFLLMQSCATPPPTEPAQVDFNEVNIQHTWTMDKITYYSLSDVETSTTNVPAGYYYQTYGTDDSLHVEVTGSGTLVAHYQLVAYLGKNVIVVTSGSNVDTVEVTSLTESTLEVNTKLDVSSTTASGHWEKDYLSR